MLCHVQGITFSRLAFKHIMPNLSAFFRLRRRGLSLSLVTWRVRLRLPASRPTNEACSCVCRKTALKPTMQTDFGSKPNLFLRCCMSAN